MRSGGPVAFRFNGRAVQAPEGAPLLAALPHDRLPILQRSIRYHRPRAPFCGIGYCTGCLVRVNGTPNVRACRYRPRPGDSVVTENSWPSPRFDLLGVLDVLFARGIDTVHGFRRPRFAVPWFHAVVRRLAGYGSLPRTGTPATLPNPGVSTEVLIVGAGRAGTATAERLTELGSRPLVIDRDPRAPRANGYGFRPGAVGAFLPPPSGGDGPPFRLLAVPDDGGAYEIRARSVVVATGGYDASLLFPGNDRPGVLTGDGAESLIPPNAKPPFAHGLLVGGGPRAAAVLDRFGQSIDAVVAPGAVGSEVAALAASLDVALYPRTLLLGARGRRGVRSVVLAARGGGERFELRCDAVLLAHRRLPSVQLLFQAGAAMAWVREPGAYLPVREGGATTVPGLYVTGAAAGAADSVEDGRRVADDVARSRPPAPRPPRVPEAPVASEMEGYYREWLQRPPGRGKLVACACEDVLLDELEEAERRGFRGIEVLKRYTSLGTGLCQGRYCLPDALLLLAIWEGRPPADVGYITQRPPVVPAVLAQLAGLADPEVEAGT
ncbi:MAG TPA: 2Fe-2S iron-sulfur cluster-binding protein [Thermoplasmata archaeon]|nr:2Fe-2S iron-sulfur cluster-binding protein [Thermoplasmata archaeon]